MCCCVKFCVVLCLCVFVWVVCVDVCWFVFGVMLFGLAWLGVVWFVLTWCVVYVLLWF